MKPYLFPLLGTLLLSGTSAIAATLTTISVTRPVAGGVIPSTVINYAVWNPASGTTVASFAANFNKAGGVGTISAITNAAGSGGVRGTTNTDPYTLATPPNTLSFGSTTNATIDGVFAPDFTPNQGVTFSITNLAQLTGGQTYRINVWGSSFAGGSLLDLSTDAGATTQTVTLTELEAGKKPLTRWTFDYNPDNGAESLAIALRSNNGSTGQNYHAVIQAVDISIVPEPSSAFMLLAAGGAIALRRRRA